MKSANCAGKAPNVRKNPDARDPWFPGKGHSLNTGKILCFTCPVRKECDDYSNRTKTEYGMWAGKMKTRNEDEDA